MQEFSYFVIFCKLDKMQLPPNPEIAINDTKRIPRIMTVSASPTVGGFAGYFKNGITKIVNHIKPERTSIFLTLLPSGNALRTKRNTIPTNAAIDVPRIAPAKT